MEASGSTGLFSDRIDEWVTAFKQAYEQNWHHKSRPYPGIQKLISRLLDAGFQLAVLSNKPDAFAKAMITHYFPKIPFSAVMGQKKGLPIKPDPTGALLLCEKLRVSPGQSALAGDTGSDMKTAMSAGMTPLGVLWGFRSASELKEAGAFCVFETPEELGDYLIGLSRSEGEKVEAIRH